MIRVLSSSLLKKQLSQQELDDLLNDFQQYKETGRVPDTFGRDVPFDDSYNLPLIRNEEVQHLHMKPDSMPAWPIHQVQYQRTSDVHLVYCQGSMNSQCYYLMSILTPNAHDQARDNNIMYKLGVMAESFRMKY